MLIVRAQEMPEPEIISNQLCFEVGSSWFDGESGDLHQGILTGAFGDYTCLRLGPANRIFKMSSGPKSPRPQPSLRAGESVGLAHGASASARCISSMQGQRRAQSGRGIYMPTPSKLP